IDALDRELRRQLAALPGVTSASYSEVRLLSGGLWRTTLRMTGAREPSEMKVDVMGVGAGFFATMQIPLLTGRTMTEADVVGAAKAAAAVAGKNERPAGFAAALVNDAFVRRYFPGRNPIGELLEYKGDEPSPVWQIVGVVGDTKYDDLRRDLAPTIYTPA